MLTRLARMRLWRPATGGLHAAANSNNSSHSGHASSSTRQLGCCLHAMAALSMLPPCCSCARMLLAM